MNFNIFPALIKTIVIRHSVMLKNKVIITMFVYALT